MRVIQKVEYTLDISWERPGLLKVEDVQVFDKFITFTISYKESESKNFVVNITYFLDTSKFSLVSRKTMTGYTYEELVDLVENELQIDFNIRYGDWLVELD